jgi:hypothetical protein
MPNTTKDASFEELQRLARKFASSKKSEAKCVADEFQVIANTIVWSD